MKRLTKVLAITSIIILVFAVILGSTMFTLIYRNAGPIESTAPNVSSDNIFTTETRSPESDTFPNQQVTTSVPGTTSAPQTTATPPTTTAPSPETTSPPETEPPEPEYDFILTLSKDRTYYILSGVGGFKGTELVVPETYKGLPISEIGNRAFEKNETLKTILIPGTVKIIRECAFEYSAIETVTFMSEGLEVIENGAFRYSKQLKNITLPNTLKTLGGKTFMECESLEKINIPGGVTKIEMDFCRCKNLKQVDFENGLKEILTHSFTETAISELNLPDSLIKIEGQSFDSCINLESVVLPKNLKEIIGMAFANCNNLKSITVNAKVDSLDPFVFGNLPCLETINVDSNNPNYMSVDGVLFDKSGRTLIVYPCGRPDKSYTVPEGTSVLGQLSFLAINEIEEIILPKTLERIEQNAFAECENLKRINLPENLTYIGWNAFEKCTSLEAVVIPGNVTEIGGRAFAECIALKEIIIPESVAKLGQWILSKCENLRKITVKGNTHIEAYAFAMCENVESIEFSGEDVYIDPTAFTNMTSLKTIIVSDKNKAYKVIDNVLFSKDGKTLVAYPLGKAGNEYTVPAGVKVIKNTVFANNTVLERVNLPDGLEVIEEYAFEFCSNLKYVNFPDSLKTIGICAFSNTALTEVVIPEGIETVEGSIFVSAALETITIPKSMKVIMSYLVYDCKNLKTINYGGTMEEWKNIEKQWYWNGGCPEITVICTDGTVTIPASNP